MKTLFWLAVLVSAGVLVFIVRYVVSKQAARERASEARAAELLAQMSGGRLSAAPAPAAPEARPAAPLPTPPPAPIPGRGKLETQKLLFDAARRAGEADEPALAIQLYARLLARFPESAFADEVRAATAAQKRKLKN